MFTKAQLLKEIEDLPEVFSIEELLQVLILNSPSISSGFEQGKYSSETKLSDYAGAWANDDRTAEKLRKDAWQRNQS
jgi:hypothetical protein